jgi:hypothetical protein
MDFQSKLNELEKYLEDHNISWEYLEQDDYEALVRQWITEFYILSFTANRCPPIPTNLEGRVRFGYKCKGLSVPDLSIFNNFEIVVFSSDFAWTMIYTHEDDVLAGPYFTQQSWIMPIMQLEDSNKPSRTHKKKFYRKRS